MVIFVFWGFRSPDSYNRPGMSRQAEGGRRSVSRSAQEKMPFSAWNRLGAPSEQDLGQFSARQAVGIPFRAGKDAFFCLKPPRSTIRAGFGAFFCPAGGWYPVPRRKRHLFLRGTASEHHPSRIWGNFLP